jgi:hypothetical protein
MSTTPETCSITVWLRLETARYSIAEISERIGIRPDFSHKMGELRYPSGKQWEVNVWMLKEHKEVPWDLHYEGIQEAGAQLLRRLDAITERFHRLCEEEECDGQFLVGTVSKEVPGLHLSNQLLRRVADLGVDVEIDVICPRDGE